MAQRQSAVADEEQVGFFGATHVQKVGPALAGIADGDVIADAAPGFAAKHLNAGGIRPIATVDGQGIPSFLGRKTDDLHLVIALAAKDARRAAKVGQVRQDQQIVAIALIKQDVLARQVCPDNACAVIARAKAQGQIISGRQPAALHHDEVVAAAKVQRDRPSRGDDKTAQHHSVHAVAGLQGKAAFACHNDAIGKVKVGRTRATVADDQPTACIDLAQGGDFVSDAVEVTHVDRYVAARCQTRRRRQGKGVATTIHCHGDVTTCLDHSFGVDHVKTVAGVDDDIAPCRDGRRDGGGKAACAGIDQRDVKARPQHVGQGQKAAGCGHKAEVHKHAAGNSPHSLDEGDGISPAARAVGHVGACGDCVAEQQCVIAAAHAGQDEGSGGQFSVHRYHRRVRARFQQADRRPRRHVARHLQRFRPNGLEAGG